MTKFAAGPIVPGNEVIQLFRATANYLSSISVKLATYDDRLTSKLSMSLFRLTGPSAGQGNVRHVVTSVQDGAGIANNDFFDLYFEVDPKSAGHLYMLKVHSDDAQLGNAATTWLECGEERISIHEGCFVNGIVQGEYGLLATAGYSPPTPNAAVPETLIYSPVTQCNLSCIHCISRETREHRDRLPQSIREQIRSWCRRGLVKKIYTDYSGDILWADQRWPGELDFLISLNVPYHIDTNGACLSEERGRKMLESRLAWLNVSLDAADPKTYARVRKGAPPLRTVLRNAAAFARQRRELCAETRVELSLGFTLMRGNLDELPAFLQHAVDAQIPVVACRHLEAYTDDMAGESLWNEQERYNEVREEVLALAGSLGVVALMPDAFSGIEVSTGHRPCPAPWSMAVLLGNGDVNVCCLPRTKIGNLHEKSMDEIWSGKAYSEFRLAVNSPTPPPACNACGYSRRTGNRRSYLPHETISTWVSPYDSSVAGLPLVPPSV